MTSAPIPFPEHGVAVALSGACDAYVETDDGLRLVVDYKTMLGEVSVVRFADQLRAYGFMLENPSALDKRKPEPVDAFALLVYRPEKFAARASGLCGLNGTTRWVEIGPDEPHCSRRWAALPRCCPVLSRPSQIAPVRSASTMVLCLCEGQRSGCGPAFRNRDVG